MHAMKWFERVKAEVAKALQFTGKGLGRGHFQGAVPDKYKGLISPSDNPVSFFPTGHVLSAEDFCLPNLYIWWPEAMYQMFYQEAWPCCPWHRTTDCVLHGGWMDDPRHGHTAERVTGVLGRRYYCKRRKKDKLNHSDSEALIGK